LASISQVQTQHKHSAPNKHLPAITNVNEGQEEQWL